MGIPTLEASEWSSKFKLEKGDHPCLYYESQNWDFFEKRDGEKSKCHCFCSSITNNNTQTNSLLVRKTHTVKIKSKNETNKQTQNIMLRYDQQTH